MLLSTLWLPPDMTRPPPQDAPRACPPPSPFQTGPIQALRPRFHAVDLYLPQSFAQLLPMDVKVPYTFMLTATALPTETQS